MKEFDENFQEIDRWTPAEQLPEGHADLLHINPLEFIAIIVNVWFLLHFIRKEAPREGGHHVLVCADNTSAISWMKYAAPYEILLVFFAVLSSVISNSRNSEYREQALAWTGQYHSGRSFESGRLPLSNLRYRSLLPSSDLAALPDTIRPLIHTSQIDFIQRDRGHIRRGSDKFLDSRVQAFRSWCDRHSIGVRHFFTRSRWRASSKC